MTAGNVTYLDRHRRRAAGRQSARRDRPGVVLWARRSADYDAMIVAVWRQCDGGALSFEDAGQRHYALVELRDGRPVVA